MQRTQRGDSGTIKTKQQTTTAGSMADDIINRQFSPRTCGGSETLKKTRSATNPSIIPNAVHIWNCITKAPLIWGGEHSAAKMGQVADFGPIPNPKKNLAINMCHHELTNPCQRQAAAEKKQVMNKVPRRPKMWLNGTVSQHPMTAEHRYGAEFKRPVSHVDRESSPLIPNSRLKNIWAPFTTVSSTSWG